MKRLNRSLIAGFLFGIISISMSIAYEIGDMSAAVFFHPVGLIAVFGGILATALVSAPISELKRIFLRTYYVIAYPRNNFMPTLREAVRISVGLNRDSQYLETNTEEVRNAMLKDGLAFLSMGYKTDDIRKFLEIKRDQNEAALGECSLFYFSMAKMGPAFGLLGTLVGLIILLYYHMSSGNMDKIASSMGIALTATLYGVGVANLLFSPLADYLQYNAERGAMQDALIIEAVIQIKERRHPVYLLQALKSYVPREDYMEVDELMKSEILRADGNTPYVKRGGDGRTAA